MNDLIITQEDLAAAPVATTLAVNPSAAAPVDTIALLLADKRSAQTKRAYQADYADFFADVGGATPANVGAFVGLPTPTIALRLAQYKAGMLARGLAEATVNRRLAALRSLLKFSVRLGFSSTDGRGLVDGEKVNTYRDTRGIDLKAMKKLISLPDLSSIAGKRDAALLRLLCENALRRAEVCTLAVTDFEAEQRRLLVTGKGRGTQKEPVTVSTKVVGAIMGYLLASGHRDGALFRNADHRPGHAGAGLTSDGLYAIVRAYGTQIGVKLAPHKLRHSSITAALEATGGDVRKVQKLSRHKDLRTLTIYDDARDDHQGEVSGILSKLL